MPTPSAAPPAPGWEAPRRARLGWPLLLLVGTLVVAGAGLAARVATAPGGPVEPPEPIAVDHTPTTVHGWMPADGAVGSWELLPDAPLGPRSAPVVVWTGTELLVWGGRAGREGFADGAAYDPAARSWRPLAEAPHAWRPGATVVATWTGRRLLTLVSAAGRHPASAFAYDPEADRWAALATPPAHLRSWQGAGWTGSELVILAFARDLRTNRAAAYDPEHDRWRRVPPARVVGDESPVAVAALPGGLAVFGEMQGRPAVTQLDPGTDRWSDPEPLPAGAGGTVRPLLAATAVDPAGERMLLGGVTAGGETTRRVWAWSPQDGWAPLAALEAPDADPRTTLAWGAGRLLAWIGEGRHAGAVLEPGANRWRPMAPPPLPPRTEAGVAWTGEALAVWGGLADDGPLADGALFRR